MTKYIFQSYYFVFGVAVFCSILQLIFPRIVSPEIANSSGLLALQDFYGLVGIYLVFATIFGIYLLALSNKINLKFQLIVRFISFYLIFSVLIFGFIFAYFAPFLSNNIGFLQNLELKDIVILELLFIISQGFGVLFYQKKLMKKL